MPRNYKVNLGIFLLHNFVDNEIDKNVHRQKCAFACPPWVGKLYKVKLGHFFVDSKNAHFVGVIKK